MKRLPLARLTSPLIAFACVVIVVAVVVGQEGDHLAYLPFVPRAGTSGTTRVSIASDGTEGNYFSYAPSISADGRFVAFLSSANNLVSDDTNGVDDIFVHDRGEQLSPR